MKLRSCYRIAFSYLATIDYSAISCIIAYATFHLTLQINIVTTDPTIDTMKVLREVFNCSLICFLLGGFACCKAQGMNSAKYCTYKW